MAPPPEAQHRSWLVIWNSDTLGATEQRPWILAPMDNERPSGVAVCNHISYGGGHIGFLCDGWLIFANVKASVSCWLCGVASGMSHTDPWESTTTHLPYETLINETIDWLKPWWMIFNPSKWSLLCIHKNLPIKVSCAMLDHVHGIVDHHQWAGNITLTTHQQKISMQSTSWSWIWTSMILKQNHQYTKR